MGRREGENNKKGMGGKLGKIAKPLLHRTFAKNLPKKGFLEFSVALRYNAILLQNRRYTYWS
jgi:hypothetical protein